MKQKRSYDNYDYNEAYQYDLDKEIEKAAKEKFRQENPLLIDFEEQWKEQQAKLEEWEYERLLKEGKVESLYRTSTIKCKNIKSGKEIAEVMIYPSFYNRADMPHTKKKRETKPSQKNLNDKNARRYFTQTANLNFGSDPEALHVTATYSGKYLPDTVEQAEQEATNFLRRVQYRRKKEGLPPLKYMIVTAYTTKRNSETPVRIHHHIIMNGGLDRDVVEDLWRKRRRKGQKKGDKIGFCNADRLQADENGIAALCTYLVKQGCGKKRWNSSHNLERPYSRTNDGKYNRRQIEKWAKEHPPREFWEKKYPGWTLTDDDYGVQYEYNDFTGWAVYLKLRKKE